MERRLVIVNADDFGLSAGVNRGIIAARERGIVTSTSLMVRGEAADAAAEYARGRPELDVGLHIDLGEWRWAGDAWEAIYEVVPLADARAVELEVERQVTRFRRLVGAAPTHLDSHQHVHKHGAAQAAAAALARSLAVPLRHCSPGIEYCGEFYGQTTEGAPLPSHVTTDALVALIARLSAGVTEIACHPGFAEDLPTMYRVERRLEAATLCDPRVRAALVDGKVVLTRFSALPPRTFNAPYPP